MELRKYTTEKTATSNTDSTNAKIAVEEIKNLADKSENIHKDHRSRLKTQFIEYGLEPLTDVQKLELLLFYAIPQKDTNPIAHELISTFGSLKNVFKASYSQLMNVKGVKENTATLITLTNSMLNYTERPSSKMTISSSSVAKEFVSKFYYNVDVEQFYVICLTKSNEVIKSFMIKSGTIDEVDVQIRTITQVALDCKCNKIIINNNNIVTFNCCR